MIPGDKRPDGQRVSPATLGEGEGKMQFKAKAVLVELDDQELKESPQLAAIISHEITEHTR